MKKTVFGLLSLLFSTDAVFAQQEEVLYCSDEKITGFNWKKDDYQLVRFSLQRFKAAFSKDHKFVTIPEQGMKLVFDCKKVDDAIGSGFYHMCVDLNGQTFHISSDLKRYTRTRPVGYLLECSIECDSLTLSYGRCEKF